MAVNCVFCQVGVPERNTDLTKNIESPDILHNGHRYRHVPFLPERRPAATGRIKTDWQLGNIQAAAPMPLTSPGNDDGTGGKPSAHTAEKHCRTRPTNIEAIHPNGANGPTEAINGRLETLRGIAFGFRNLDNYITRRLLHTGGFRQAIQTHL